MPCYAVDDGTYLTLTDRPTLSGIEAKWRDNWFLLVDVPPFFGCFLFFVKNKRQGFEIVVSVSKAMGIFFRGELESVVSVVGHASRTGHGT